MKNFRTYDLAQHLYKICSQKRIKNTVVRNQFDRALLSVVLNLAEGSGKRTAKERRRFYDISLGSLREVQAILEILSWSEATKLADQLGASIYRLIQNPGGSP